MKIVNVIKSGLAIGAIAAAAGCSGGGYSPSAPRPAASAPSGSSLPSSFGKSNTAVTLSLKSRSSAKRAVIGNRKRNYISAATQGLIVSFTDSSNAVTNQGFTLAPGAAATTASPASCTAADPTSGSYTCTLYFSLSGGSYTATVTTYDAPQSGTTGTPAAATGAPSAIALSTDTEPVTVTANQSNNFSFTLHGIVEAFDAEPQYVGVPASPSPSASPLTTTFHALDGDFYLIDAVDASTSFYTGAQPSGPFSAASFPVTASDENAACATPCVSLASTAPIADPTTEGVPFSYNGGGTPGDGSTANPPYYGLIGATGPAGYAGNVSATVGGTAYAATAYVVPFFAIVDQSTKNAAATDASDVSFTTPSDSVNVLAVQYHLPTNSTGYTIDASACGSIASASAGTVLASGYGESFTLTPGSQSGTCVVTLSDGAGDTGTINVTSTAAGAATVTVPCANPTLAPDARHSRSGRKSDLANSCSFPIVQQTTQLVYGDSDGGQSYNFVVKNPGDMLVCAMSDYQGTFFETNDLTYGDNFANAPGGLYVEAINTSNPGDSMAVAPYIGPNAVWCGEFAGYDADSMTPNGGYGYDGNPADSPGYGFNTQQTPAVVPPAKNSLVITAVVGNDTVPYTVSAGYSDVYSYLTSMQSIDVQVKNAPTADATTPVSNTFGGGDGNPTVSGIIMFAPTGSVSSSARTRHAAMQKNGVTNTFQAWNQRKN